MAGHRNTKFCSTQRHLSNNQLVSYQRQQIALDPKVLHSQHWIVIRWVLDYDILKMNAGPGIEACPEDRDRLAKIFADELAQPDLSVRRLDVKVNRQQPEPGEAGDCNEEDERCLKNVFHKSWESRIGVLACHFFRGLPQWRA